VTQARFWVLVAVVLWTTTAGIALAVNNHRTNQVRDALVDQIAGLRVEILKMSPMKTECINQTGRKAEITTDYREGWTPEQHVAAHIARCQAFEASSG
jgi:hypothetical protein